LEALHGETSAEAVDRKSAGLLDVVVLVLLVIDVVVLVLLVISPSRKHGVPW